MTASPRTPLLTATQPSAAPAAPLRSSRPGTAAASPSFALDPLFDDFDLEALMGWSTQPLPPAAAANRLLPLSESKPEVVKPATRMDTAPVVHPALWPATAAHSGSASASVQRRLVPVTGPGPLHIPGMEAAAQRTGGSHDAWRGCAPPCQSAGCQHDHEHNDDDHDHNDSHEEEEEEDMEEDGEDNGSDVESDRGSSSGKASHTLAPAAANGTARPRRQLALTAARRSQSRSQLHNIARELDVGSEHDACAASLAASADSPAPSADTVGSGVGYLCTICGKVCSCPSALDVHLRTHSGEKPFRCNVCGKRFSRKSHVKVHRRVHSGERPYRCDICGHRFAQASNLKAHVRTHTGERPYKCHHCSKSFTVSSSLNAHLRVVHGIEDGKRRVLRCDICDKPFNWRTNVAKHRRTCHPNAPPQARRPSRDSILDEHGMQAVAAAAASGVAAAAGCGTGGGRGGHGSGSSTSDSEDSAGRYQMQWVNIGAEFVQAPVNRANPIPNLNPSANSSANGARTLPLSSPGRSALAPHSAAAVHAGLILTPVATTATTTLASPSGMPSAAPTSPLRERGQTATAVPLSPKIVSGGNHSPRSARLLPR